MALSKIGTNQLDSTATPTFAELDVDNVKVNGNTISSTDTNGDITLDPNGTGDTIIASGNVGIGTASPSNLLTLQSSGSTKLNIRHTSSGDDYGYIFRTTGATTNDLIVESEVNGTATERMRIDSSGNLIIGATAVSGPDGGNATGIVAAHNGRFYTSTTNGGNVFEFNITGTGGVGSINVSGSSTSFNTSSDHRLKENVADMTGAIDRVKALAPKRFNFIADADKTVDGFLAHEAQAVVPEAITGTHNEVDDDGNAVMQGIDQSKLVPLLTAALKESIAKIETLEAKVAALEAG